MTEPATRQNVVCVIDPDDSFREQCRSWISSASLTPQTCRSLSEYEQQNGNRLARCLIVDAALSGPSGIEYLRAQDTNAYAPPVILVARDSDVDTAVSAMKLGALDFFLKPITPAALLESVHRALQVDDERREEHDRRAKIGEGRQRLTAREAEVMELVVTGHPNKSIASQLGISQKTVEVHRSRVMEKMRAASLADLVRMHVAFTHDFNARMVTKEEDQEA